MQDIDKKPRPDVMCLYVRRIPVVGRWQELRL